MKPNRYCFSITVEQENVSPTFSYIRKSTIRRPMQTVSLAIALIVAASSAIAEQLWSHQNKDSTNTPGSPTPVESSENPVLKHMHELHPLGEKHSKRSGDLNGDGIPERLRIDDNGSMIVIEDDQGNFIGSIKHKTPVQGVSIMDIDSDGRAEIHVLSDGLHRMRAYDHYGNQLASLDKRAIALAENYYKLAMERSLDYLHDQPVDNGDLAPPDLSVGDDEFSCGENPIMWDEVTVDAWGRPVIEGTDGPDVIVGTNASDVIIGLGDYDTICGRGGDDWLYGDKQQFDSDSDNVIDFIYGGSGDDIIFGGGGTDFLFGGDGDDVLYGGLGDDFLKGDQYGIGGDSPLSASWTGNDFLVGMWGEDIVMGGPGNDSVNATAFDDIETETNFEMGGQIDADSCFVHGAEAFWAGVGQCESVLVTDW